VADDDVVISHLLCSVLQQHGYQVTAAFDTTQAVFTAGRDPRPDAILLDLSMPGGTGNFALNRFKASTRTSTIPVIVISSNNDPATVASVMAAGAAAFVEKPVDFTLLLEKLGTLLGHPAQSPR
jgi:putative two-component system response regulator